MIQCIIDKTIRLEKVTNNTFLTAPLVSGNSLAHMVRLRVLDSDGEPADLTGISATGAFNRPDGHQVTPIAVTITGNVVECVFPASCYTTAGRFRFMLDLNETVNNETALRTAFVLDGLIEIGPTGSVVDPGTPVPNIQAAIANAQLATTAANTAAQTATTAAAAAQDVADNVEGEVSALKSAVNQIAFHGKGATYYSETFDVGLKPGHLYRVHIKKWDKTGLSTTGNIFQLGYKDDGTDNFQWEIANSASVLFDRYDIYVPPTTTIPLLLIGGRATGNAVLTIDEIPNSHIGTPDISDLFEMGDMNIQSTGWTYLPTINNKRVRTKVDRTIHMLSGDIFALNDTTNARYCAGCKKLDGTYIVYTWRKTPLPISTEGEYVFLLERTSDESLNNSNDLSDLVAGSIGIVYEYLTRINNSLSALEKFSAFETIKGFLSSVTTGSGIEPQTADKELTTSYIKVNVGTELDVYLNYSQNRRAYISYYLYDASYTPITTRNIPLNYVNAQSINIKIKINTPNVAYIRITWKTYGDSDVLSLYSNTVNNLTDAILIDSLKDGSFINVASIKSINHRGYSTYPENTLIAFKESRRKGFRHVETDVRFTSDGVPVLLHDSTINRTARNADGTAISTTVNIADITYEEALTYDFGIYKGAEFAGTKIPKLEDFVALCKKLGLKCYIELKEGLSTNQLHNVCDVVKSCAMQDNVTYFGGVSSLETIHSYSPNANLCVTTTTLTQALIDSMQSLFGVNKVSIGVQYNANTLNSYVELAIANDVPLEVWTLDQYQAILSLPNYISGILSDSTVADSLIYQRNIN